MMVLAWTKTITGRVYPTLWYTSLPTKGEGEPGTLNAIVQTHTLTEEQERELDRLPDGVSRVDTLAKTFPYNPQENIKPVLDTPPTLGEVYRAIDGAVDNYRTRMRKHDGQTAQIDKENGHYV